MKQLILSLILVGSLATAGQAQTTLTQAVQADQQDQQYDSQLTASNTIQPQAQATYTASQAIRLMPGFSAKAGSVFSATVGPAPLKTESGLPKTLALVAYPNPVGETIQLQYSLPQAGRISYSLTNLQGQVLYQQSETELKEPGAYELSLPGAQLEPATYLFQLRLAGQTNAQAQTIRLLKKP